MTVLSIQNRGFGCLPNNPVTGPASCRTASSSSYIGNGTQSLNGTRERFERATNHFPFAAELLEISTMWGGNALPSMMYGRASAPRKRWNSQGEIEEVYLEDGMGFQLDGTYNAIEYLKTANLLILDSNEDGYEKLSVDKNLQQYLKERLLDSDLLRTRSLMLMCHLFPGNKEIEPFQRGVLGRLHLQPFQSVVEYIPKLLEKKLLSTRQQHEVIGTLLESSTFSDRNWKFKALELADAMLVTAPCDLLETYAAIRRKAVHRLVVGTIWKEPSHLLERLATCPISNFLYWKWRLSRAEDCVHRDDFDAAVREVFGYAAINPTKPSTLEYLLGKEVRFEHARFVYLSGRFEDAKILLDQELKAINYERSEKLHDSLVTYLAGVNCETGNTKEAVRLTKAVLADSKEHSRSHVSLAEAYLHDGMTYCDPPTLFMDECARKKFSEAKIICEAVLQRYRSMPNFDTISGHDNIAKVDRINYLRVTTIMARISFIEVIFGGGDLSAALNSWVAVFNAIEKCGWSEQGFMEGISHLTMGAIYRCLDNTTESELHVKTALNLLNGAGRRHLIVGLGAIWPEFTEEVRLRKGGRLTAVLNAELPKSKS
ncbi:hypothetical protein VE03_10127 [Pseudogymnoascus sp. 23342-1-I1]|nr:hypothetical protein VE03_10127 [Pseudogymnoascus sp. 23342-1-I1]